MLLSRVRPALAALALLAGCGGPQIPPAQNYATIAGRVYDASSNQPVSGVTVRVDVVLVATSGSDGMYKVANVPIGQYELSVSAPQGYTVSGSVPTQGSVAAGESVTIDIPLSKQ
ncbi:MAG: carboxypeptidase regulatory-like domain-containing protein [Candidatus Eremiobacteraeota bacterium]|nr:carboxypeptidase regulatory-like domain-containing protein [Candidatus Eremiobacteraeota bacterium]